MTCIALALLLSDVVQRLVIAPLVWLLPLGGTVILLLAALVRPSLIAPTLGK